MSLTFGTRLPEIEYRIRPAAYGVVAGPDNTVGVIILANGYFWLPGGGRDPGESAEDTLIREVREELARGIRVGPRLGAATEYFYSGDADCYFQVEAELYQIELTAELPSTPEYTLHWRHRDEVISSLFLHCHRWGVEQCWAQVEA